MKKLLTLLSTLAILQSVGTAQTVIEGGNPAGHTRFWTFYNPYPSNYIGSREWMNGEVLSGDWWGVRNYLDDTGVEISANYTNNIAGNPVGGRSQGGFTYTDNTGFGLELNLEKLIGWSGAKLFVSGLNRAGSNLSAQSIGNQFTVQQVYGSQTAIFYALAFEQKLLDDKVSIKVGRFGTGDDFASSPLYWLYMNNGIDGNPQALPVNTGFTSYPAAVWAARLRVDPTPEFNAMAGIYQTTTLDLPHKNGVDWSMNPNDGVLMIGQVGWTPEFFKKPVEVSAESDGKTAVTGGTPNAAMSSKPVTDGKSFKSSVPTTQMKGLPGHYWFGSYFSPWQYSQFGSTQTASNSYGFYWHADQMVWQESPGSDQGLTLWSSFVLSPQQNISKLPFRANAGAIYKGLVPTRDQDYTMLGFVYGNFSDNYARTVEATGAGHPEYEIVLEAAYRINFTKFAYFQPDLQCVINPGGTGNIPNALVLGAQMGVTF